MFQILPYTDSDKYLTALDPVSYLKKILCINHHLNNFCISSLLFVLTSILCTLETSEKRHVNCRVGEWGLLAPCFSTR